MPHFLNFVPGNVKVHIFKKSRTKSSCAFLDFKDVDCLSFQLRGLFEILFCQMGFLFDVIFNCVNPKNVNTIETEFAK